MIQMTADHMTQIVDEAKNAFPNEACGLLAGSQHQVTHVFSIPNQANTPETRYVMDASSLYRAYHAIDELGLTLIAVYHSHPNGRPIPSETDIQDARFQMPNKNHVIISLMTDNAQVQAWRITATSVDFVELQIGAEETVHETIESPQERFSILFAMIVSALILIVTAILLLPPAPTLPIKP